jgi:AraC-like DNA-binding protein/mannose-6-phosphate isomerase-like protein (cupin superfamily)
MTGKGGRDGETQKRIAFVPWSSSFVISSEGKHVIEFPPAFPLVVGCHRFTFDNKLAPNYHDYLEISCVAGGTGIFRVGDRSFTVREGDLVVLGTSEVHTLLTRRHEPVEVISLFFLPELLFRPGGNDLDFEYIRFFYNHSRAHSSHIPAALIEAAGVRPLMERIYGLLRLRGPHWQLRARNCLCEILVALLEHYEGSLAVDTAHHDRRLADLRRLNPVFRLIERRCHEQISLQQAADTAHMSPQYFCRFFRKVTGMTLVQYIQRTRIDRAKRLMLSENMSITQVAQAVGFDNLSYFYRVFRGLVHLTPLEFLRRVEEGRAIEG